jgi:hypothetical protein
VPESRASKAKRRGGAGSKTAAAAKSGASRKSSAAAPAGSKRRKARVRAVPTPDRKPEFIDIDRPPPGLPELTFPNSPLESSNAKNSQRRSQRLRTEIIGGALLCAMGVGAALALRTPAFLLLTLLVLVAVVAYEFLVTSLE